MGVDLQDYLTLRSGPQGRVSKGGQRHDCRQSSLFHGFLWGPSFETRPWGAPQDEGYAWNTSGIGAYKDHPPIVRLT